MSIVKQTYGRPAVGLVSRIPRTQKVIKRTQCLLPRQTPSFPHQRNVQQLPLPKYRDTHIWGQTPHPPKKRNGTSHQRTSIFINGHDTQACMQLTLARRPYARNTHVYAALCVEPQKLLRTQSLITNNKIHLQETSPELNSHECVVKMRPWHLPSLAQGFQLQDTCTRRVARMRQPRCCQ